MKVLHLSSERTWRGGEQQIAYLMGVLKEKGVENVLAARAGSEMAKRYPSVAL
jgi:L-malate glycosyltransferase